MPSISLVCLGLALENSELALDYPENLLGYTLSAGCARAELGLLFEVRSDFETTTFMETGQCGRQSLPAEASMLVEEAKEVIAEAISNGEWIERATDYSCVVVSGIRYSEPAMFDALEQLRREGDVLLVPKQGSPLCYHDIDRFKAAECVGNISEFVAAGIPRSKSIIQAQLH